MVFCKKAIRPAIRAGLLRTLRRIAKNDATVTFLLSILGSRCASSTNANFCDEILVKLLIKVL